jgi:hypothetical protein
VFADPLLAVGTKEGAPLGLDDPPDDPFATSPADFPFAVINAVQVLVAAVLVERVAVGPIGEG